MKTKQQIENTTITVSRKLASRLNMWKYELKCRTIEEVIDRILKITPASELPNLNHTREKK